MKDFKIDVIPGYSDQVLDILEAMEKTVFDQPYSREKLQREASTKNNLLLVTCSYLGNIIGYKAGYEMTSRLYYSWIGGVSPDMRRKGAARLMLEHQHAAVKEYGYRYIRTNTENKYSSMLLLNIRCGFDIIGVYKSDHDAKQTILLGKAL